MPQRLAYTKTQRIYHIFWRAALKHHQKVQMFGDKRPTFSTLTSAKQGPERTNFWTLQRRRETPFSSEKESVRTNKVLAGCPQHQYSHCGLCQPECRRAGKSSDTQVPKPLRTQCVWGGGQNTPSRPPSNRAMQLLRQLLLRDHLAKVWRSPKTTLSQRVKENLKKKQTTGASSATIKH